jgi:hypothetical protein
MTNKVPVLNCFQFYDIAEVAIIQKTNLAKFDYKQNMKIFIFFKLYILIFWLCT